MRILIVDDDYVSRTKLKGILNSRGDCDGAPDGKLALEMFSKAHEEGMPFDLITVDIQMEGMNGKEVVKAIREIEAKKKIDENSAVKIIMITVKRDMKDVTTSFFEGCNAYCPKPITPESISRALDEAGI